MKKKVGLLFFVISNWCQAQLLSDTLLASYTIAEVDSIYIASGIPPYIAGDVIHPIEIYKLIYETQDALGGTTYTSGTLFIPKNDTCNGPMVAYQHGTISDHASLPSNLGGEAIIGIIAATGGYRVAMTDYVGMGDGPGFHPYVHAKSEATAVIDMLRASKAFCDSVNIEINPQLFLMGYSQGGHATMAALREIELYHSNEFAPTATIPMAGPYDVSGVQRLVMESNDPYSQPGYFPYIALSYDMVYDVYDSLQEVFIPPYDSIVNAVFDGQTGMGTINSLLPSVINQMIDSTYYNNYLNDPNHPFKLALADNDVYDWVPQSYLRMVHCSGDQVVPYGNAQVAYDAFIAAGADSVDLINGGTSDHSPCAETAIIGAKLYIDTRAQFCMYIGDDERAGEKVDIEVSPNPFVDQTTIIISGDNRNDYVLEVFDMTGKLVYEDRNVTGNKVIVSANNLDVGMYLFTLSGEEKFSGKLIVQ